MRDRPWISVVAGFLSPFLQPSSVRRSICCSYSTMAALHRTKNASTRSSRITDDLRTHFDRQKRFTFEDLLGRGAFGMTFRVAERIGENEVRKLAVKRACDPSVYKDLRKEINYLRVSG